MGGWTMHYWRDALPVLVAGVSLLSWMFSFFRR